VPVMRARWVRMCRSTPWGVVPALLFLGGGECSWSVAWSGEGSVGGGDRLVVRSPHRRDTRPSFFEASLHNG
jgi:hypothetical protein